ncbi:MAG: MFS transporter [Acetobacteraceae bacterium]
MVGGWCVRRRAAALGVAAAGTGCGMLIVPAVTAALIARGGWRTTDIVIGVGCAVLLAACAAAVRPPPPLVSSAEDQSLGGVIFSFAFVVMYVS